MSHLPEEVVSDILSRLPVEPLLRFRSVSIPWRALIDSSDFVKLHLNRSVETKSNLCLVMRDDHLFAVDFDSLDGTTVEAVKLDHHPLRCQDYETEVWGSCNGLICLSNALDTMVLWNPSTRKSRRLPYASIEFQNHSRFYESRVYGFGYDSVTDDYKVVRIVVLKGKDGNSFHYEVKVYSLNSNSWHRVEKFPHNPNYPILKRTGGVLASGAVHWVVTQEPEIRKAGLIVAFDLVREEYRMVPQPEYSDTDFVMNVEGLGGFLSVLCNYYLTRVDIWVMKDYGVKESWTKLISLGQLGVIRSFHYVRPVAFSKSGEEVLLEQDTEMLIWYDFKRKMTVKKVKVRGIKELFQVEMCVGSLVSLDGGGSEGDGKKQQELEERNMRIISCQRGSNWFCKLLEEEVEEELYVGEASQNCYAKLGISTTWSRLGEELTCTFFEFPMQQLFASARSVWDNNAMQLGAGCTEALVVDDPYRTPYSTYFAIFKAGWLQQLLLDKEARNAISLYTQAQALREDSSYIGPIICLLLFDA
ncbi:unnamed protein product [Camellia sinensis]